MKKNHKKVFKIFAIIMVFATICTTVFTTLNTKAETKAPQSLTIARVKHLPSHIGSDIMPSIFSTSAGGYAYCNNMHKTDPIGLTMTLVGEASPGIAHILSHGYPNTSITGNAEYDDYITRIAIWWYLDETTGTNNLTEEFKTTMSDPNNFRSHIIRLVNEAKAVTSYPTANLSLTSSSTALALSEDKKYYETTAIGISGSNLTGNYTISISGGPEGSEVINANSYVTQSSFASNETFKVRVPVANVTDMSNEITITATANSTIDKAYEYTTSSTNYQNVYTLFKETTPIKTTMKVTLTTSKITVTKVDAKTKNTLAGATFELTDSQGNKITSWTSTTNAHVVKNLPNGTYYLKETTAPKGYKIKEETTKIVIDKNHRDIKVEIENEAVSKLVNITKIDKSTNQPLAGARLVVKNEKGETIADFTSTENPYTIIQLEDGNYTVEEMSAPTGYKKSDEIYHFTISDDTPTAEVIFENYPEVVVPNTSTNSSILSTILGMTIFISGIGFVYYYGKKENE